MKMRKNFLIFAFMFLILVVGLFEPAIARADVEIDEAHFPDPAFRAFASQKLIDKNQDGILSDEEVSAIKTIHFQKLDDYYYKSSGHYPYSDDLSFYGGSSLGIYPPSNKSEVDWHVKSLKGIEYFSALTRLRCDFLDLTELDVSKNTVLLQLSCFECGLKELNISGNTALTFLNCGNNNLRKLDVTNNTALEDLHCGNNMLTELDVSHNIHLKNLICSDNKISDINLSNNIYLESLWLYGNRIFELDLSKNNALQGKIVEQWIPELKYTKVTRAVTDEWGNVTHNANFYRVDLTEYISKTENFLVLYENTPIIDRPDIYFKGDISEILFPEHYYIDDGVAIYYGRPQIVTYDYKTGNINDIRLRVHLTLPEEEEEENPTPEEPEKDQPNIKIAALERRDGTDNIICDMDSNGYIEKNGYYLDETMVAKYPYNLYGKKGFTSDGNTRLILRVQSNKPGYVKFALPDIGAKLERLTTRNELYYSSSIETFEVEDGIYQASAVLIAPESFPQSKKFPSDSFKVNVIFKANDGTTAQEYLDLKIEAAPVVLIHGFMGNVNETFGVGQKNGIWHALQEDGFDIFACNYKNWQSSSEVLSRDFNVVFDTLSKIFDKYAVRDIACTRADIVVFGHGGLVAERFMREVDDEKKYAISDGNNWTVRSYKQGMVRRFVAVAVPFWGTPWADILTGAMEFPYIREDKIFNTFPTTLAAFNLMFKGVISTLSAALKNNSAVREMMTGAERGVLLSTYYPVYFIYGNIGEVTAKEIFQDKLFDFLEKMSDDFDVFMSGMLLDKLKELFLGGLSIISPEFIPAIAVVSGADEIKGKYEDAKGLARISSQLSSLLLTLYTVNSHYRMFSDYIHDTIVGPQSGLHSGYDSKIFTGWRYRHDNICHEEDVGNDISLYLRYPIIPAHLRTNESFSAPAASFSSNSSAKAAPEVTEEFNFIEALSLNVSPANFKISDNGKQTVKFSLTAKNPTSYDIYCAIKNKNKSRIFVLNDKDGNGKNFEEEIILSGNDTGIMQAFCFSHNPEDTDGTSILISNTAQIAVLEDLSNVNITNIEFSGSAGIYTNVSAEIYAGLYATDSNGNMYDVSSPLNGTTWSIDNPEIAKVNDNGSVVGLKEGTATLTTIFRGFSASISVDVGAALITENPAEKTPPIINKTTLPKAIKGSEYNFALTAYSESSVKWSAKKLPDGLSIDPETGVISGVPTKAKTSTFTVTAENESGKTSETFTISVYELPSITNASVKEGTVNKTYSSKFKANGSKPITWSATGLPDGLNINSATGQISGATSAFGIFPLIITAKNPAGSDEVKVNLIIRAIPPKISGKFDAGFLSEYYSSTITLSKGTEPIEWSLEGDLPEGLTFDTRTATLSGTPAQTWNGSLVVTASNDAGVAHKSMSLKIKGTSPKVAGKFEKGNLNEPYSSALTLSKGTLPVKFSFEGTLPNGLNFNPETLTLSGTPTEIWNNYITVTVSNGAGSYSKAFKIQIKGTAPKILTSGLPLGTVNENYDFELEATGSNPITWTAENLPDGLSLNGNRIEGTPSEECRNLKITVRASNPIKTVSKTFRLTVNEAVVEETSSPAPEEISDKSEEIKPEENIESDSSKTETEKIIFGAERDVSSVNMTVISEDYEIVAVLPEIHVTESGMYEINVELNETIEVGRELIWFACPKNSEPSDDDKIAEFYDEEGNEITEVPENHKITVSAWFNEGVIYEPVVAVKIR